MERNFTNENFEHFLQRNAGHLRMRPGDQVWKNISKRLNQKKGKMFALASSMLCIGLLSTLALNKNINFGTVDPLAALPISQPATQPDASGPAPSPFTNSPALSAERNQVTTELIANPATLALEERQAFISGRETFTIMEAAQDMAAINSEAAFQPPVVDAYIPEEGKPAEKVDRETTNSSMQDLPLTIESVTNSFANRKKSKLTTQVFFTPTVSYRKLSENKSYMRTILPQGGGQMEPSVIQDSVTHRPNIGFEVGLAVKYPLSRNLKVRGGVQFNMNRYDIKAFHYTTEIATIALNVGNRVDSVVKATNYRNQNGFRTNWLQNFYFQVSTPIGIEYLISNKPDRQFGIATSIQPTYVIGDRAYLISTDYKNYAQVPSLIRRWNVATNFEAFMSYSTGQLNWQVGPQVRYQLLSSFMDKYPVKENLFDFGLKVGISLNKNK